jgi:hypothetical protein
MLVGREVNRNIIVGTRIYIATEYAYPRDACGLCVERYSSDCECVFSVQQMSMAMEYE